MHIKTKQQEFCIYGGHEGGGEALSFKCHLNSISWILFRKINLDYY